MFVLQEDVGTEHIIPPLFPTLVPPDFTLLCFPTVTLL